MKSVKWKLCVINTRYNSCNGIYLPHVAHTFIRNEMEKEKCLNTQTEASNVKQI